MMRYTEYVRCSLHSHNAIFDSLFHTSFSVNNVWNPNLNQYKPIYHYDLITLGKIKQRKVSILYFESDLLKIPPTDRSEPIISHNYTKPIANKVFDNLQCYMN